MELAERYAYAVYTQKSFTAAAKSLYISQPGLSAMITKLEKKLGFAIFDRSTAPVTLTPSGRIYMEYLQEMITEEELMLQRIRQHSENQNKSLAVSVFSQTAYYLFATLCTRFSTRYPHVSITADIGNNSSIDFLADKLRNNVLDAILTDSFPEKDCLSIPIFEDRVLLAINKKLCQDPRLLSHALSREEALFSRIGADKPLKDTACLYDIPFLSFDNQVTSARIADKLFHGEYKRSSYHIKGSRNLMMHYNMMREGLGATLVDASHLSQPVFDEPNIVYFAFESPAAWRPLYCVIKESRANEPLLQNFITVAHQMFSSGAQQG